MGSGCGSESGRDRSESAAVAQQRPQDVDEAVGQG